MKIKITAHIRLGAQGSKGIAIMKFNIKDMGEVFSLKKSKVN
jgi:hypothetical protein